LHLLVQQQTTGNFIERNMIGGQELCNVRFGRLDACWQQDFKVPHWISDNLIGHMWSLIK